MGSQDAPLAQRQKERHRPCAAFGRGAKIPVAIAATKTTRAKILMFAP